MGKNCLHLNSEHHLESVYNNVHDIEGGSHHIDYRCEDGGGSITVEIDRSMMAFATTPGSDCTNNYQNDKCILHEDLFKLRRNRAVQNFLKAKVEDRQSC